MTTTRTRTTRKSTTSAAKAPAKKATTAKATAKKAAPAPKVKKSDLPEWERDYTYLAEKAPTALHDDFAQWMLEATGYEPEDLDAFIKGVQLAAVLRGVYQRSPRNKSRSDYRPLAEVVVHQRSVHMVAAHQDARKELEAAAAKATKATPRKRTAKKA